MKVIFFGASDFSVPFLHSIQNSGHKITLCVTGKDKSRRRGRKVGPDPVKKAADLLGITALEADVLDKAAIETILKVDFEYIVLVSFGKILPEGFLDETAGKTINVHPSLLPRYRGPSPIMTSLLNGDLKTGISLIKISREVDTGDIYDQKSVDISPYDNKDTLEEKLINLGTDMLLKLMDVLEKKEIRIFPQRDKDISYTRIFTKGDMRIDWDHGPASIHNRVRAFSSTPGCFTVWKGRTLKILKTDPYILAEDIIYTKKKNGTVLKADNSGIFIKCGTPDKSEKDSKKIIAVLSLKPQDRNVMSYADFINGYKLKPGDIFE